MAVRNPFSPSFGTSPPVLAGRDAILDSVGDALAAGPTHPDYTALFIGVRGAGKTVMLNAVEDLARSRGWLALSDSASSTGLPDRLTRAASDLLEEIGPAEPKRRLSSLTAAGFGVGLETVPTPPAEYDLRGALSDLGDALAERETGLLITVDEMQSGDFDEIREFGSVLQHVSRREGRPVAFIGAALPQIEDTLLSDDAITFLQRCSRYDIDRLNPQATRRAIAEPISQHGRSIDSAALDRAVAATSGYAFMVQLVGFHSWQADANSPDITDEHVAAGIAEAQRRIGRMVFAPTWRTLSDVDRRFLLAMAQDDAESKLTDIADRLGATAGYAGVYRQRLLRAGMILPAGWGRITLAHHAARDWLREQDPSHGPEPSRERDPEMPL
ncbi:MAG: ATP-binding protein [Gammaproteobacteria bacterium]|nr:ATP-binding protein [Gammaproteobacteria bacterium]